MLNRIDPTAATRPQRPELSEEAVNSVFKVLHGFYGNLFLSKYATAEITATGENAGVLNARAVWAHGLRGYEVQTVKDALARCIHAHPEYPPSLPQFAQLCAACKPRPTWKPKVPPAALEMSPEMRAQQRTEAQRRARDAVHGAEQSIPRVGLDPLKRAIASAVGEAGGDEAAALARLDRELNRRMTEYTKQPRGAST